MLISSNRGRCSGKLPSSNLTSRESEVISWAKLGKTTWEIAMILGLSEATVKFHFKNVYHKLEVTNRAQAIAKLMHTEPSS